MHASVRFKLATAAVFGAVLLIAGCGGSSPTTSTASSGGGASWDGSSLAFSKCMRANGVPDFPDLSGNGMRIESSGQSISVNGVSVNPPAFRTARQACQKYIAGAAVSPAEAARDRQYELQFAKCMRHHGVSSFPDAKVIGSSGGNQTAYLPGIDPNAPAFQAAAKVCGGGPKGP